MVIRKSFVLLTSFVCYSTINEKGEPKLIAGHYGEFTAVKKAYLARRKQIPFLVIYHNRKPLIKQYQIGSWNEVLYDEVVLSLGGNVTSGYMLGL